MKDQTTFSFQVQVSERRALRNKWDKAKKYTRPNLRMPELKFWFNFLVCSIVICKGKWIFSSIISDYDASTTLAFAGERGNILLL